MKKAISLMLAVCMIFGLSTTLLAEPTTDMVDSSNVSDIANPSEGKPDAAITGNEEEQYDFVAVDMSRFSQAGSKARSAVGDYFGNQLEGNAKVIYTALLSHFQAIDSNGSGISMLTIESGLSLATTDDCEAAVDALLKDHTELIYWVAKGSGNDFVSAVNEKSDGTPLGTKAICIFPVIPAYKGDKAGSLDIHEYFNINANKGGDGQTKEDAMRIADKIVRAATGSDYDKIKFFNQRICDLTSYDDNAAKPNAPYGDASQMINVFLGKPVVCEGYAKAFKYLCDEAGIGCLIVEGSLAGGNHMWNYVQLEGKWYIADITNNDGHPDVQRLLAIGSANVNYSGRYTLTAVDAGGNTVSPLNPDVTVETVDFSATTPPTEPENIKLVVTGNKADEL